MRARNFLAGFGLLAGAAAGAALWLRQGTGPREHVDLYYADGSMKTLTDGSPDLALLLGLAREAIHAARV